MTLRQLRYFAGVAKHGSFHKASAYLHVAQPALSRQIQELEADLGVALLIRSSKGVKLSPAGEVLYREAAQMLSLVDMARTKTVRAAQGQFGHVQVGLTSAVAEMQAAVEAFADARAFMQDIDFRFSVVNAESQAEQIERGQLDIGVLFYFAPHPPGIRCLDLRTERYKLLVPRQHELAGKQSLKLRDLQDYDLVFPPQSLAPATYSQMLVACLNGGLSPRHIIEVANPAAWAHLVRSGLALAFCVPSLFEHQLMFDLALIDIEDLALRQTLAVWWNPERETPALMQFIARMQERLTFDH